MEVVGHFIKSISCEREETLGGELNINNKISVTDVEEEELKAIGKRALKISYEFESRYVSGKKKVAEIKITGHIFVLSKDASKILKKWKKEKKLEENYNAFFLNVAMRRCLVKAISLADEIGIPSPVPLPQIRPLSKKGEETKYIR